MEKTEKKIWLLPDDARLRLLPAPDFLFWGWCAPRLVHVRSLHLRWPRRYLGHHWSSHPGISGNRLAARGDPASRVYQSQQLLLWPQRL